jgi:hypothetical protein
MPDNKPKEQQSQVELDEFLKRNPQYKDAFDEYYKDLHTRVKPDDPTTKEQQINERAELNYYADILSKELQKKDPKAYSELMDAYGEQKQLSYNTRRVGANEFGQKHPSFYLSPEEQKQIFDTNKADWDRYNELRQKYGADLHGDYEDPNDPESWKVGARHAVLKNPAEYYDTYINPISKDKSALFKRSAVFNPETDQAEGHTDFSSKNTSDPSKNVSDVYVRRLSKMSYEYVPDAVKKTENGNVSVTPGYHFYKHFDDGTTQEVSENVYQSLQDFNNSPGYVKIHPKYAERVNIQDLDEKNKKIAQAKLDAMQNTEDNAGQ